jgi:TatD DNase family protein
MKLFDSHCHLDDRSYDGDLETVIRGAAASGVGGLMIVGINRKSARQVVRIAESIRGAFASVGVHPHDAGDCDEATLTELADLAGNPVVRAWGETGLDFNRMRSPRADQERWFVRQLETAAGLNLPLIFHERDSEGRFLEILREHWSPERRGVVHCFSGNRKELEAYLDLGLFIGITGILTIQKRGEELRKLARMIPADRLLIETDAPYLTPAPEKNQTRRNEPAFVKSTLLKLAEIREQDPERMADITWENACRLFHLDPSDFDQV